MPVRLMRPEDVPRIQSSQALGGHPTGVGSFPWRAQRAAARNSNRSNSPQRTKFSRLFKILFWVGIIYFCLHLFHLDVWKIFDSIRENEHVVGAIRICRYTLTQVEGQVRPLVEMIHHALEKARDSIIDRRQVNLAVERIPIAEYTDSVGKVGEKVLSDQAREKFKVHAAEKINRLKNVPMGEIVNTVKDVSQRTVVHMVGDVARLMRGFPGAWKNLGAGTV
ncbi:hypothetical protein TREMEDRAFT_64964 [Tremella mesenterica DSM 1558]|uniref:uncharacterized protein n=1 Tax=Tremella mesenterica (strain ATCC 24925 / CBS 8224 / DSM 1558 / NBRC 9311 / NRRL Y-6157 / RJB 2259-6 / UBC 559-6) TaxID=578456 RepID=UPI0003F4A183|nr:uncharacterized protein TREMEDRAFT_64964 [Tremella mesenterica DSM 1558]EIW67095.1 hypothetical protein TREMEDRAFT_64964 [Tremella mesenterica DSM 1558]